ncbi:hypothetical protein LZ496_09720 [Sphingomonas sp. NSE70-1]|uniref:PsiF repeat-containing protein n=1 Tax=Sphingomonas caseinilyticus TaxID=2908205 RepID=A0ABT0RVK5_9SPHN|nr:hypothetical protein [Sphingomonas caseinilyticus]MCL6699057.1 hypothetical protein [Sphingomonas caseinilyticus]
MRVVSIVALGLLITAPAIGAESQAPSRSPTQMSPSEIKAHNASLDATDPNYIKCRKSEVMGSLVKKQRTCRTNAQWKEANALGNEGTRDMVEGFARSGGSNGN